MVSSRKFELPSSGYEVLEKILHAYAYGGDKPVSLDDVAGRASMNRTQVSANHPFLLSVGVVSGGKKKQLTPAGRRLALAVSNKMREEISTVWAEIMRGCEDTRKVLDMIRVQGGIAKGEFPGRILHTLGIASSSSNKTGANCLVDVLLKANLIQEKDGKYAYNAQFDSSGAVTEADQVVPEEPVARPSLESSPDQGRVLSEARVSPDPSVHIDIQIHIDANASAEQIDQVFASMAKHLYNRG